ncbi:Putative Pfs, NACHT and Ankyrin domain protein [[Torrubiella] hemipterigena]|uniref:Putative Pfs, NACHT and Ankyrin domain protein n=1 Tax=[Torrubiella] hemipterigena TaxID=1531966 RepID=A0A0A1SX64_9HYPO|nr:Putative Pfs, NACHT and Ankyrin domain protein [[Torrubiella] hemipterigena]
MANHNALDSADSYAVAWIAALSIERAAAEAMLDEEHTAPNGFHKHQTDDNIYTWGRIGEHNVVITSLAAGVYGTTSAATTASSLLASLPSIRIGLFVGIGGGIADNRDIRLGDIVVSQPDGTTGGVCQYDLIKAKSGDKRERKGFLGRPPTVLLNALTKIQAAHERSDSKVPTFLHEMFEKYPKMGKSSKQNPGYGYQGLDNDRLFNSSYNHTAGPDCRGCEIKEEVQRDNRDNFDPEIHYGTIASGNTLVKDAATRNRIAADVGEECLCFEMEAAGLMNHFPCLVIRGICDYADAHKNDRWQRYASATAAAYAKELLEYVPAAEVQETKKASEVLNSIQRQIDSVHQTTTATKVITEFLVSSHRTDKIQCWLRPSDPSTNANHARSLRHEGTGAWLLENPIFKDWYLGSRRHLWLQGLAGSGKTVLSTTVLDHLGKGDERLILSFFFDFSDTTKQTLDCMLRSIAFQIYKSNTGSAGFLDQSWQAHEDGNKQPAIKTLEDTVHRMLAVQKKCFIILDALDESTTRNEVITWIKKIVSNSELGEVRLISTSRPEREFISEIPKTIGEQNCLTFDQHSANADIRSYVSAQLSQRDGFRDVSRYLRESIRMVVGDGAQGMFRWAFCQMDSLAQCPHEAAIEEALASLPQTLEKTYQRMIQRIPSRFKTDAIRLLQFLVHSERPLKLSEVKEVIATQIECEPRYFDAKRRLFREADVLGYCPGLVTFVQATSNELHLAHFSVKEYLIKEEQFSITTASISITMTCLTYLTSINVSHDLIEGAFPMADYAAKVWNRHAILAQASEDVVQTVIKFLADDATFQRWDKLYRVGTYEHKRKPRIVYTCLFGLLEPTSYFIDEGAYLSEYSHISGSGFQAASLEGHLDIVKLLLDAGAEVNVQGGYYGSALRAASSEGHLDIIKLLLDAGAEVNAQGGRHGSALYRASLGGHLDIVKLLLNAGAEVNAQGGRHGSALQVASSGGFLDIVKLLLDAGAKVNAQGGHYGSALGAASSGGYLDIVKLLLNAGAEVNAQGGEHGSALHRASSEGHLDIIKLLLDVGAEVNTQGGRYGSALGAASWRGYADIVKLLLDAGAEVNTQGGRHGSALRAASSGGYLDIVRLLLDAGAEVNAQGGHYGSALQAASSGGYLDIVKLLLDAGVEAIS